MHHRTDRHWISLGRALCAPLPRLSPLVRPPKSTTRILPCITHLIFWGTLWREQRFPHLSLHQGHVHGAFATCPIKIEPWSVPQIWMQIRVCTNLYFWFLSIPVPRPETWPHHLHHRTTAAGVERDRAVDVQESVCGTPFRRRIQADLRDSRGLMRRTLRGLLALVKAPTGQFVTRDRCWEVLRAIRSVMNKMYLDNDTGWMQTSKIASRVMAKCTCGSDIVRAVLKGSKVVWIINQTGEHQLCFGVPFAIIQDGASWTKSLMQLASQVHLFFLAHQIHFVECAALLHCNERVDCQSRPQTLWWAW